MSICTNSSVVYDETNSIPPIQGKRSLISFTVAVALFCCLTAPLTFIYFRPRYARLRIRQPLLVFITSFGLICTTCAGPLFTYLVPYTVTPCWIRLILLIMAVPSVGGPLLTKLIVFNYLTRFAQLTAEEAKNGKAWKDTKVTLSTNQSSKYGMFFIQALTSIIVGIKYIIFPTSSSSSSSSSSTAETDRTTLLVSLRFLVSGTGIACSVFLFLVPFLIFSIIIIVSRPEFIVCYGCLITSVLVPYIIIAAGFFIFGSFVAYRVRNTVDTWGMRREVLYGVMGVAAIIFGLIMAAISPYDPFAIWDWQVLQTFACIFILISQTWIQILLAIRKEGYVSNQTYSRKRKSQQQQQKTQRSQLATSLAGGGGGGGGSGSIDDDHHAVVKSITDLKSIRANPTVEQLFEQHLVLELGLESLLLLRAVDEWKRNYHDTTAALSRLRAKKLWSLFFRVDGLWTVNVPAYMFTEIEEGVNIPENQPISYELFDNATKEISHLLSVGAVPRFLKSNAFKEFMESMPSVSTTGHNNNNSVGGAGITTTTTAIANSNNNGGGKNNVSGFNSIAEEMIRMSTPSIGSNSGA
jgi:hypothetical protein